MGPPYEGIHYTMARIQSVKFVTFIKPQLRMFMKQQETLIGDISVKIDPIKKPIEEVSIDPEVRCHPVWDRSESVKLT